MKLLIASDDEKVRARDDYDEQNLQKSSDLIAAAESVVTSGDSDADYKNRDNCHCQCGDFLDCHGDLIAPGARYHPPHDVHQGDRRCGHHFVDCVADHSIVAAAVVANPFHPRRGYCGQVAAVVEGGQHFGPSHGSLETGGP